MKSSKVFFCKNCVAMSTRPRISFDKNGICNACKWSKKKFKYNWKKPLSLIKSYIKKEIKNKKNIYNCIVPVSGGKDGSYVYHQVKNKLKLNPLAVTINPALPQKLGIENLNNFSDSGPGLISINPPYETMRRLNFYGFKYAGLPYYGWLISIYTGVIRIASQFNINLIFHGEDGELEYGGTTLTKDKIFYSADYIKKIYLENKTNDILGKYSFNNSDLFFFTFPESNALKKIKLTHYSYFENWDPYRNYLVAKKHYGLKENTESNEGTFSNFAQNDQKLYALHTYLMYLKFGFGRCNQDSAIEIRRGAMKRQQAVELIKLYDNQYPHMYLNDYLNYFQINKKTFDKIIDKWANKKLFYKVKNHWQPKFEIK